MLRRFERVAYYLVLMWIIFGFSLYFPLNQYGLYPRRISGLIGVLTEPFLHANISHLLQNSIFLLLFGFIYSVPNRVSLHRQFWFFTIFSGVFTWLLGAEGLHIGASGVVFGFFGYLTMAGYARGTFFDIMVSSLLLVLYGTVLLGVLPLKVGMSWESHLFGLIAGLISAKLK